MVDALICASPFLNIGYEKQFLFYSSRNGGTHYRW